jgi:hypothetical protein
MGGNRYGTHPAALSPAAGRSEPTAAPTQERDGLLGALARLFGDQ